MSNVDDFDDDTTPEEAREALLRDLRTVAAPAAFRALLEVCQNPNAPAPARATAGTALLRAAGYFNRDNDSDSEKPIEAMSAAELDRAIRRIEREQQGEQRARRASTRKAAGRAAGPDIFE